MKIFKDGKNYELIQHNNNINFESYKKTKSIKFKWTDEIFQPWLEGKLLLKTLEGNIEIKPNQLICRGEAGDVWIQSYEKLIKKYKVIPIDNDNWYIGEPLPDNICNATQIGEDFAVIAHYGEDWNLLGQDVKLLFGKCGDYLLNSKTDATDYWIVDKTLFENTYEKVDV